MRVIVRYAGRPPRVLTDRDMLDGENVVPGLELLLAGLFTPPSQPGSPRNGRQQIRDLRHRDQRRRNALMRALRNGFAFSSPPPPATCPQSDGIGTSSTRLM